MKARKRILATLLSVAVAATTVLPGAVAVNAATIVTETPEQEIEKNTWTETMDRVNTGGELYWHIQSSTSSINPNTNNDYSADNAPMVVLDMDRDMAFDGTGFSVSTEIFPNGTSSKMRFGIMIKYVDPTHWAYLNYDTNKWLLEYKCEDLSGYPAISALANKTLTDYKDTNVTVTYKEDGVDVAITPVNEEEVVATIGNEDDTYDGVLLALENYAAENSLPIRYGFKAATYGEDRTDVNLKNMSFNGSTMMDDTWEMVKEREGQLLDKNAPIGGKNYSILDAKENAKTASYTELEDFENGTVSAVFHPATDGGKFALAAKYTEAGSVTVGYDGSNWYYAIGAAKTQADANPVVEKDKDYQISMAINDGKLSANVALAEEGAQAYTVASNIDVSAVAAGTIAVSAETGTELWVRDINYNKVVKSEPTELIEAYDKTIREIGAVNTDNKYYSDSWATYESALQQAKDMIDSDDEITQADATSKKTALERAASRLELVDKTALEDRYNEFKDTQNINYTAESWNTFQDALKKADEVLKKIEAKKSVANTDVTSASTNLANAHRRLVQVMASDEEKAALTALYNELKALNASAYTADTWAAVANALKNADDIFALGDELTQYDVQAAAKALQDAKAALKLAYTVSFVNTAYTVDATATVETKVTANTTVTYTSSDPSVATVDANGIVTGVKAGTAVITATAGTVNATATVTVTTPAVTLNAKSAKLQKKKSTTALKVASKIDTDSVASWTSSKPGVASVTNTGKITAKKTGKTVITVTMKSGATASCTITVQKGKVTIKSIKVNSKKVTLNKGKKFTIEVTKNPITATDKITYSSNKKSVAAVNSKGVITAKKKGTCKITVKCGKKKATVNVTVK